MHPLRSACSCVEHSTLIKNVSRHKTKTILAACHLINTHFTHTHIHTTNTRTHNSLMHAISAILLSYTHPHMAVVKKRSQVPGHMKTFDAIIWLGLFRLIAAICSASKQQQQQQQQQSLNKFYLKCKATQPHTHIHRERPHPVSCHVLLPVG